MGIGLEIGLYIVAAAIVATIIRLYDSPKTSIIIDGVIQWAVVVPVAAGAAVTVPIACWVLGIDVTVPEGFIQAVALGILGLSGVKAILNIAEKEE